VLRRLILIAIIAVLGVCELAPALAYAQDNSQGQQQQQPRKSLFDILFGGFGNNNDQQATPPPPPVVVKPKKGVLPPVPKPPVAKSATATRLAVFGDTMASDLAAALDRFYSDDPNIIIINQGVPGSSFTRPDFFDWNKTAVDQVSKNTFDIAVMFIGLNDRQSIKSNGTTLKVGTDDWNTAYKSDVSDFVQAIRGANKPIIWVGLPAMGKDDFSTAVSAVSAIQRLAVFAGGGDFVDIYDRFVDDNGNYTDTGPDLNGNQVQIRRSDGIRFTSAGADNLAYYVSQTIKLYYRGGGDVGLNVTDALAGTDAALMVRPPYQGLGQTRLLEVAGAVIPLSQKPKPALELVTSAPASADPASSAQAFDVSQMLNAPVGRVDAFGVGTTPSEPPDESKSAAASAPAATAASASAPPADASAPASVAATQ